METELAVTLGCAFDCSNQWGQFTQPFNNWNLSTGFNNVLTFFFCSSLLTRRLALDFVFTKQVKYLLLSKCAYRKPPQVMQLFRFSFRFRYDLTFQFQLLCGEFSQYTTLNKQSIASKKIFLLIYVTFVDDYVLRSLPLMQASVLWYKLFHGLHFQLLTPNEEVSLPKNIFSFS